MTHADAPSRVQAQGAHRFFKSPAAVCTTGVPFRHTAQESHAPIPLGVQLVYQCAHRIGVREAHGVLNRVGQQIPGFYDRHACGFEQFARRWRVAPSGDHDALGSARQHLADQALLSGHVVIGVAQQHLQATRFQRSGQAMGGV